MNIEHTHLQLKSEDVLLELFDQLGGEAAKAGGDRVKLHLLHPPVETTIKVVGSEQARLKLLNRQAKSKKAVRKSEPFLRPYT